MNNNTTLSALFNDQDEEEEGDDQLRNAATTTAKSKPNSKRPMMTAAAAPSDDATADSYERMLLESQISPTNPNETQYQREKRLKREKLERELVSSVARGDHHHQGEIDRHQPGKSLYIDNLLEQAKKRKLIAEQAYEARIMRDREAEVEVHGKPSESFVTSGYEARLKERSRAEKGLEGDLESHPTREAMLGFRHAPATASSAATGATTTTTTNSTSRPALSTAANNAPPPDPEQLKRQREARRAARVRPPTRLTRQAIEAFRERAAARWSAFALLLTTTTTSS